MALGVIDCVAVAQAGSDEASVAVAQAFYTDLIEALPFGDAVRCTVTYVGSHEALREELFDWTKVVEVSGFKFPLVLAQVRYDPERLATAELLAFIATREWAVFQQTVSNRHRLIL